MNQKRKIVPEDLWKLRFVGDPQVSPDGHRVVFVVTETDLENNGYRSELWMAETDDPESVRPLTRAPEGDLAVRDGSPRWSPDGKKVAFVSNRDGEHRIYCISVGGGEARPVGDFKGSISAIEWSPDGEKIAFVAEPPEEHEEEESKADVYSTRRLRHKFNGRGFMDDSRRNQVWVTDAGGGETQQLTDHMNDHGEPNWSPDGERLLFTADRRCERKMYYVPDLYSLKIADGSIRRITEGTGPVALPRFSPAGDIVAFFGHDEGDSITANQQLCLIPPLGGDYRSLTAGFDRSVGNSITADARFDDGPGGPVWCRDGESLLFNLTDGGECVLYEVDLEGDTCIVKGLPPVVTSYSANSTGQPTIAVVAADYDSPGDVWIARDGGQPVKFTGFNEEFFSGVELARPERVTSSSPDGRETEGWLLRPIGHSSGEKYPLVLEIHGGPAGTSGWAFFHQYQLLAAAGFGVLYTNPRGSKGYGQQHAAGVIGDWGGGDYHDLMAAVEAACDRDWVDEARLGVTGGSYGGYMTNWIVSQTTRFTAAVTFRSISNLYTKYGCSDIGFYSNRRGMGGAELWEEEDFIMSRSPIRYAPNVETPTLIVHAEDDLRCPMEQAEQWFVALKRLGVECEFVRYDGEHHDLSRSGKPYNRVDRLHRMLDWFKRHLTEEEDNSSREQQGVD